MNKEEQIEVVSPTTIKCGHIEWFELDTRLVGKVMSLLAENEHLKELQHRIDKAIEYINSFEEDNPDYNSGFYNDGCGKTWISFDDLVENTTKILKGEE